MNTWDLAQAKFTNFLIRFQPMLHLVGVTPQEIQEMTWDTAAPHVISALPVRELCTHANSELLFAAAEAHSDDERVLRLRLVYGGMSADMQKMLWRYVDFFFRVVTNEPL